MVDLNFTHDPPTVKQKLLNACNELHSHTSKFVLLEHKRFYDFINYFNRVWVIPCCWGQLRSCGFYDGLVQIDDQGVEE